MNKPIVKKYDLSMLSEASACFLEVFSAEPFCFDFLDMKKAERYLGDITKTPGFIGFRFELMGKTVGFCFGLIVDYFAASYYDIKEIFIDADIQGRGIGSNALCALEEELAGAGIKAVTLSTSRNIPAFGFYLKNNYAVSEANVHMSKIL